MYSFFLTAVDFCHQLAKSDANSRNADWFPESCTTQDSERGKRCHMKCMPGFSLKPNALASVDCINVNSTIWGRFENEVCVHGNIYHYAFTCYMPLKFCFGRLLI